MNLEHPLLQPSPKRDDEALATARETRRLLIEDLAEKTTQEHPGLVRALMEALTGNLYVIGDADGIPESTLDFARANPSNEATEFLDTVRRLTRTT